MDAPTIPKPRPKHEVLLLWVAAGLFPVVAALVMGAVHADYDCTVPDDTAMEMLAWDFLGFPAIAAVLGYLTGFTTWRPRGRVWANVGGVAITFLSLVWGAVVYWMILISILDAACY